MHGAVVEEAACEEQPQSLEELSSGRVVYHRDVEQSAVGHRAGCLSVAVSIAYADGHHRAVDLLIVHLQPHLVVMAVEEHEHQRREECQVTAAQHLASLSAQVHDVGGKADVHAVEEISADVPVVSAVVADAAQVNLPHSVTDEPVYGLRVVLLVEAPIAGEVVHHAVGYESQVYLLTDALLLVHEAVHGIVKCRVAAHDDDGRVAVV